MTGTGGEMLNADVGVVIVPVSAAPLEEKGQIESKTSGAAGGEGSTVQRLERRGSLRHPDGDKTKPKASLVERYRRASVFDEIMARNLHHDPAEQAKHHENVKRLEQIVDTSRFHVGTDTRSRLVAFEMVRHIEEVDDEDFVINPYCVASMPEDIRKGFLRKVFGIVTSQLLIMLTVMLIFTKVLVARGSSVVAVAPNATLFRESEGALGMGSNKTVYEYQPLGKWISLESAWVGLAVILYPALAGGLLMCFRRRHPLNLYLFSNFSVSFGFGLGMICVWMRSDIFVFSTAVTAAFTILLSILVLYVPARKLNLCNLSLFNLILGVSTMLACQYGVKDANWMGSAFSGLTTVFFTCWVIFDVQAMQIDLTADEYITAAIDLYLDIVNLLLWLLICLMYCFGMEGG